MPPPCERIVRKADSATAEAGRAPASPIVVAAALAKKSATSLRFWFMLSPPLSVSPRAVGARNAAVPETAQNRSWE
ncbi:hypothetical protein GCM10010112_83380 [Actinoplanes lobatus]|uniref:Uncharacterized protein n=1 Tax=Actinoplanes lobatus TaxID=113568 RepID=A0ABQ4AY26_9ACTN|nr:hypothetical protein GCM10010112_83380 [Actinoplanes lobatus]GIE45720.1 hypothetical protein Alo02nite_86180 [Actinoplanes lobatus]